MNTMRLARGIAALLLMTPLLACERLFPRRPDLSMPTAAAVDSLFHDHGVRGVVSIHGNVVELTAVQDADQLKRGGALWARVGPYIYLFTPATMEIFEKYPGVAAVRARTEADGQEVARVLLMRDTLHAGEWVHARNLLGHALSEGTSRPSRLEALVRWGERYTTFDYNPAWVPRDSRQ